MGVSWEREEGRGGVQVFLKVGKRENSDCDVMIFFSSREAELHACASLFVFISLLKILMKCI